MLQNFLSTLLKTDKEHCTAHQRNNYWRNHVSESYTSFCHKFETFQASYNCLYQTTSNVRWLCKLKLNFPWYNRGRNRIVVGKGKSKAGKHR